MMKVLALLSVLLAARSGASPSPAARPAATAPPLTPDALYSRRALRRARLLIQMRMLQFREERLECVRAALSRQLPPALRPQEPTTWTATQNACLPP
ncbi:MAG: hypothetical protein JO190_07240 [Candidatus Eremiobacteraeota bacterium]|nr:hypothetical protein [Candidatus Eremiobacteraeota bacterium]MBV8497698.1 hypothetical protein [Candidatus Eremiobacteraeota bacterium]